MRDDGRECETRAQAVAAVLKNRRSVRQFRDEPLQREHLDAILEAGIYAPSGSNAQNQRFLVIESPDEKAALGRIRYVWPYATAGKMRARKEAGLIGGAAAVIVVFADASLTDYRDIGEYYIWESMEIQNCAASIENMLNMAAALGVGSCWLSASERMTRSRLLSGKSWAQAFAQYEIPSWYKVQGIVILGYPSSGLDSNGFPRGEKMHGASNWATTQRKPIAHYLIGQRGEGSAGQPLNRMQLLKLRLLSGMSGLLMSVAGTIDKTVYGLEVRRALARRHEQARMPADESHRQ